MTTPVKAADNFMSIDLDAERARRASERESTATERPIILGGKTVAMIPTELPLAVLAPLRELDEEITLLLRSVMAMWNQDKDAAERWDATSLVIDVLAANPKLPTTVIDVIDKMGRELMTDEGFSALLAEKLTREDLAYLAKSLLTFYGFSVGESSPSSELPTEDGGTTSTPTLPTTTDSTPEESGDAPESPASSERAAS